MFNMDKLSQPLKVIAAQYQIEQLPNWQSYENKIVCLVEHAKENGANLLTLSEYSGLELTSFGPQGIEKQFEHVQTLLNDYLELFSSLAKQNQMYIQAGSLPVKETDGFYRNRAFIFFPNGRYGYQDKLYLPPFEAATKLLRGGSSLKLFNTKIGKIGILLCYDIELPHLAQQLTGAGAKLLLVPCCTEKFSGLTRVSISCRARAIENQCYIMQSCLVGKASWCDFIDINTGQSGIYCPADIAISEEGILAQAQFNAPMLINAELSYEKLNHVREGGETANFNDLHTSKSITFETFDEIT